MIEIRCKKQGCGRLLLKYDVTDCLNSNIDLSGAEIKCNKCKRVLRLKNYKFDECSRENSILYV